MSDQLALITFDPSVGPARRQSLVDELAQHSGRCPVGISFVAPVQRPARNGGDLLWRFAEPTVTEGNEAFEVASWGTRMVELLGSSSVSALEHVSFASRVAERGGKLCPRFYRVLLFSIDTEATRDDVQRFEREMVALPEYVDTMSAWSLGRVETSSGSRSWSYVWEQEYPELEGFSRAYMESPYHWGYVDRWFDVESPECLVGSFLCNSVCELDRSILLAVDRHDVPAIGVEDGP